MSADARLKSLYETFSGTLHVVTNIMTPEGRKLSCSWVHQNGDEVTCMVTGDSLEEVIRKVAELESDFKEMK